MVAKKKPKQYWIACLSDIDGPVQMQQMTGSEIRDFAKTEGWDFAIIDGILIKDIGSKKDLSKL